jgi:RNA-directed DNA polymerase
MDRDLDNLGAKNRCSYSRYADDITFSSNTAFFPREIGFIDDDGHVQIGETLRSLIEKEDFKINRNKIRLSTRQDRQVVTGVTVNISPNVDKKYKAQIRAMLHAWKKYGITAAEEEFRKYYDTKHRPSFKNEPRFREVLRGKIAYVGMIRGIKDPVYLHFLDQYNDLALGPTAKRAADIEEDRKIEKREANQISIWTEGKTDWMHLEAAWTELHGMGYYPDIDLIFNKNDATRGDKDLLPMCKYYSRSEQPQLTIFIFDRDVPDTLKQITTPDYDYKIWGHKVVSMALPVPEHRRDNPNLCIEFFYSDEEIKRIDKNGHRLYLSDEFHHISGRHNHDKELNCTLRNKLNGKIKITIIDSDVFNADNKNIALTKSDFADNIVNKVENFHNFNFMPFCKIFDLIEYLQNNYENLERQNS